MQVQNYRDYTVAAYRERAHHTSQLIQTLPGGETMGAQRNDIAELSSALDSYPAQQTIAEVEAHLDSTIQDAERTAGWFRLGGGTLSVAGLAAGGYAAYNILQNHDMSALMIGVAGGGVVGLGTSLVLLAKGRGHSNSVAEEKKMRQGLETWGGWMQNPEAHKSMEGLLTP